MELGREKGLEIRTDVTKRVDLQIVVTETEHHVETVTDPRTGKKVRASMADVGPEGFQVTWGKSAARCCRIYAIMTS